MPEPSTINAEQASPQRKSSLRQMKDQVVQKLFHRSSTKKQEEQDGKTDNINSAQTFTSLSPKKDVKKLSPMLEQIRTSPITVELKVINPNSMTAFALITYRTLAVGLIWIGSIMLTLQLSSFKALEAILFIPLWLLVTFGAYSLGKLGLHLVKFRECEQAFHDLQKDITEAMHEMDRLGIH